MFTNANCDGDTFGESGEEEGGFWRLLEDLGGFWRLLEALFGGRLSFRVNWFKLVDMATGYS